MHINYTRWTVKSYVICSAVEAPADIYFYVAKLQSSDGFKN